MLLELKDVHGYYGHVHALKGISLGVEKGEIVALLGNNGAGKSSTLRVISGLIKPRTGEILFEGVSIKDKPAHQIVCLGITHVPEGRQVFGTLTVDENLDLGAFTVNKKDVIEHSRDRVYELFPRLKERRNQMAGTLSGGEQQMLAIGRALMGGPKLLMLDEPSMGLAPNLVDLIMDLLVTIKNEGITILLVEQNARAALKLANNAYVIETGEISMSGTAAELANDDQVIKAYLGI